MNEIEVENLYKIYGKKPEKVFPLIEKGLNKEEILDKTGNTIGVNNVSFSVEKGSIFVLMGLSGCGKSTLIRCLNRWSTYGITYNGTGRNFKCLRFKRK